MQIKPTKTIIGKTPAPTVATFSSRGPSSITPDILKVCCDDLEILEKYSISLNKTPALVHLLNFLFWGLDLVFLFSGSKLYYITMLK